MACMENELLFTQILSSTCFHVFVIAEPQSMVSTVHVEEVPKDLEEQVEELHAQV